LPSKNFSTDQKQPPANTAVFRPDWALAAPPMSKEAATAAMTVVFMATRIPQTCPVRNIRKQPAARTPLA
jgi:hypothetical protein